MPGYLPVFLQISLSSQKSYPLLQVTQDNLDGQDERPHGTLTGIPGKSRQADSNLQVTQSYLVWRLYRTHLPRF